MNLIIISSVQKTELYKKSWSYAFYQMEDNSYVIRVLCGSVGLFDIYYQLDESQAQQYHLSGIEFLEELASQIHNKPDAFNNYNFD